jgi:hypothetical protein
MCNFGFAGYDCVTHLGINGKMTEVYAAMGLTSLEATAEILFLPQTECVAVQVVTLPIGQAISPESSARHSKMWSKYVDS